MKAVTITSKNQQMLANRYALDIDQFPIGYILVTEFGENGELRYNGVLTQANFDADFIKGQALENEFYAISRRG